MRYNKGDFVVVPNKHKLEELSGVELGLYIWLCSFANNEGECFPARKTLAKKLGISLSTLIRATKTLSSLGLITKTQRKEGNEIKSNLYHINILNDEKTSPGVVGDTTPGVTTGTLTISNINYIDTGKPDSLISSNGKVETQESGESKEFNLDEKLEGLRLSKHIHDKLIGLYFRMKKFNFENNKQYQAEYKRNIRIARALADSGYSPEQFKKTMRYCEDKFKDFGWKLETVSKQIANVVNLD